MLTVSFKSVINGVFHLDGLDPDDASDADKRAVIEHIADRYKTAAEYYKWPVLMAIEQRFFRPVWAEASTYAEGDEVYYTPTDAYYTCLAATSAGEDPEDTPAKWEALTDFHKYVDFEQAGETPIAAVTAAWDVDPRSDSTALQMQGKIRPQGISFNPGITDTSVWLEYRSRPADFAAELYDETAAYAVGDIVYHETEGNVYTCAVATTAGQTPTTTPASWTLVEFPEFLARAVKAGALSDWYTSDEKPQTAERWDAKFIELLEEQVWQLTKLQGQTGQPTVNPN